jgi:hypothetical protein
MLLSGTLYAAPMFHGEEAPCRNGERGRGHGRRDGVGLIG